jgi:hypothetical protein
MLPPLGAEEELELPDPGRKGGIAGMSPGLIVAANPLRGSSLGMSVEEEALLALAGGLFEGVAGGPEGALFLPFLGGVVDMERAGNWCWS